MNTSLGALSALNTLSGSPQQEPMVASRAGLYAERVRQAAGLEPQKQTAEVNSRQAAAALDEINQSLRMATIGVRFEFDKEADTLITKIVDTQSGEMIRQMPSEEMLQVSRALGKLQGLLVSQKV